MEEVNTEFWNLKKHLERCKDSYKQEILELDKNGVYDKAPEINNLETVFMEIWFLLDMSITILNDIDWPYCILGKRLTKDDVLYLLSLENPLKFLVTRWDLYEYFTDSYGKPPNFNVFINELRKEWRGGG
ncbi:MAG: hypothetical protein FWC91_07115 [Defluviitaleaceae bacterium]|nr:hypothetical protein [Defluviitaleaceae bacterium]